MESTLCSGLIIHVSLLRIVPYLLEKEENYIFKKVYIIVEKCKFTLKFSLTLLKLSSCLLWLSSIEDRESQ